MSNLLLSFPNLCGQTNHPSCRHPVARTYGHELSLFDPCCCGHILPVLSVSLRQSLLLGLVQYRAWSSGQLGHIFGMGCPPRVFHDSNNWNLSTGGPVHHTKNTTGPQYLIFHAKIEFFVFHRFARARRPRAACDRL